MKADTSTWRGPETVREVEGKKYVIVLAFSKDLKEVLVLRRKSEPFTNLINALGGKIEPGETVEQALEREFYEESGYSPDNCSPITYINSKLHKNNIIHAGSTTVEDIRKQSQETNEDLIIFNVGQIMEMPREAFAPDVYEHVQDALIVEANKLGISLSDVLKVTPNSAIERHAQIDLNTLNKMRENNLEFDVQMTTREMNHYGVTPAVKQFSKTKDWSRETEVEEVK